MHRLVELQRKFDKSGLGNNPVIDDKELKELYKGLENISTYFRDRGDKLIAVGILMEALSVERMIDARKQFK